MKFRVDGVLAEDAQRWWPEVRPWVESALDRDGLLGFEDIKEGVATRDMQLWLVKSGPDVCGVCITELVVYPRMRVLTVVVVGGAGMPGWLDPLNAQMERFAKAHDCGRLMAPIARRGWRPFARVRGWSERATYWRDLDEF